MVDKNKSTEATIRNIPRKTRKKYSVKEMMRIVLNGLRGETIIAKLCSQKGINQNPYYRWSKEFLEAGKMRFTILLIILSFTVISACSTLQFERKVTLETPTPALPTNTENSIHATSEIPSPCGMGLYTISGTPMKEFKYLQSNIQVVNARVSLIDGMTLIYVPEGEFKMGSSKSDTNAQEDEKPQHLVALDPFWIDQTEVTNQMFAAFLNAEGNLEEGGAIWYDPSSDFSRIANEGGKWQAHSGYADHPVVEVTWYGAEAYCAWAGRRLPTEAEWEKAAVGTDSRTYPWGEEIDCALANYGGCTGETKPVGSYPDGASPFGVLDMAGNVWEWVADWYEGNYYSRSPIENPSGPSSGKFKVLRGISWNSSPWDLRATNRDRFYPYVALDDYGFRCALSH